MIAYNDKCKCLNPPEDDGDTTCWVHHDCTRGDCTHMDGDDDYPEREQDCE